MDAVTSGAAGADFDRGVQDEKADGDINGWGRCISRVLFEHGRTRWKK